MSDEDFAALVLEEHDGKVSAGIQRLATSQLPAGRRHGADQRFDLELQGRHDLKGLGRLVRNYPHIPGGIDFAGCRAVRILCSCPVTKWC